MAMTVGAAPATALTAAAAMGATHASGLIRVAACLESERLETLGRRAHPRILRFQAVVIVQPPQRENPCRKKPMPKWEETATTVVAETATAAIEETL